MKSSWCVVVFLWTEAFAGVVQPLTSAPQLLIPAAGSTPGANGTFFHSDISIINFADHSQNVRLQWLPQGVSASSSVTVTIGANGAMRSLDFVSNILGKSGLGAILVTGVSNSGDADATAALYVNSRIWTPQPGTDGTTSQSLPAVPLTTINTSDASLFHLGSYDGSFRVNIGIVNLDPTNTQTFSVANPFAIVPITIAVVTLPPLSMQQISVGSGPNFFLNIVRITNATVSSQHSNAWIAYGSTIDNVTGDAWSELAVVGAPGLCCGPIWK